ncbi:non-ribosomal peptide synthetase [Nostoc sp. 'Peltigera membranacea cyanobiont' 213]|uniref:non-ribosomal peptide synthetase n=1 Tax=Nostoc sp. 'Peltigera membranacea cyanobiont' 213 TaxID=2014530 RepID=UPI000B956F78|nr:non-ribosomal peptide synthetase [Nostoc sp. 'Peltigera membranacea cyanobiont' 213]OYD95860.1 non-ribosomal peptide synthetase [Nostoc sp. 'Peltigera membranacea cyanobiont' 213]
MVAEKSQQSKNVESIYPLSPMQHGMLFHSIYAPDSGVYCTQTLITISAQINIVAFKRAWEKVVERYSVLRTLFLWEKRQQPLQVVRKQVDLPWNYQDWRNLSPTEQQECLDSLLQTERQKGFQLNQAPLMRCHLIQLSDQTYKFLWNLHHIILDGWSLPIIYQEVLTFYTSYNQGQSCYLPPPPPYQDYIVWLKQQDLSVAEIFWRQTLEGFTAPTPLMVDRPQLLGSGVEPTYQQQELHLSRATTQGLQSLGLQYGLTLSTLIQAAWAILLSRYSGESEVLFGVTVSGRPASLSAVENMVGLFINTLPLRVSIPKSESILPWLQQLQQKQAELQEYSYSTLAEVQRMSDIPPGISLFESLVVFENYPMDSLSEEPGQLLPVSKVENFEETNYPLTVAAIPKKEFLIKLNYDTNRFAPDTIVRMAGHLQTLLEAIVANPQQQVGQLSLLTEVEQHQLLVEWNDTQVNYPQDKCIHQLFEEQVKLTPDAVAVIFEGQFLTYQQLNERANQLAHYLQEKGVEREVLVGIYVERSLEMILGLLGILKAGGAYVPLDPSYPADRLVYMLSDAAVSILLTQQSLVDSLPENQAQVVCFDSDWQEIAHYSQQNPVSQVTSENLVYVIYTSGSTGKPKGVMNLHRGICNNLSRTIAAYPLIAGDRILQIAPFSFDASVLEIFWSLTSGTTLVIAKPEGHKDIAYLSNLIGQQQVTQIFFVPSMLRALLQQPNLENCRSLKRIFCGAEALSYELTQQLFERLNCELHNFYGPTEASIDATCWECTPKSNHKIIPIGRPIANTQIYILDSQLQPVPIGIAGELHIGGVPLARGYFNQPELTAQKFIDNPFRNGKLYKTGDLARYLSDGNIEYLGRIDNQVKLRGLRIELGEIESVLDNHSQVEQTVVILREDTTENQRLVAYVVTKDQSLTSGNLRRFLQQKLPTYMIPSAFVMLSELPLNSNGKIDYKKLPTSDESSIVKSPYLAPRNQTESILVNIWQQILKISNIGVNDNFFDLGGHSLKAISLVSQIQEKLSLPFQLKQVFLHPTIAEEAELLIACAPSDVPIIPNLAEQETYETSHAQRRFFVLQQMDLSNTAYHIVSTIKLEGAFDPSAFEKAMQVLINRHESLRTSFVLVNGEPRQRILIDAHFHVGFQDWINELNAESRILETIEQQREPFNLENSPLLRANIYKLSDKQYILFMEIHHIISDGWSMDLLSKECLNYYDYFVKGLQPNPDKLPIQYKDYAAWQANILRSEDNRKNLDYWRQKLDNGQIPRIHLPTDFLRPPLKTYNGSHLSWTFKPAIVSRLQMICKQTESTLFMALVAAVKVLLYRYSGQHNISIGTEIATRNHPQLQSLIGLFLNTLVIRDELDPKQGYKNLLVSIRKTVTEAFEHSDYPFDVLVEELAISRELNRTPLFDILVLLQNFGQTVIGEEIKIKSLDSLTPTSKFDLSFVFSEHNDQLKLDLIYNTDLFQADRMQKCLIHLDKLLTEMLVNPIEPIGKISLLSATEASLIESFIQPIPRLEKRTVVHDFSDQVKATPDQTSIVYSGGEFSYLELDTLTNSWANIFKNLGIQKDTICGIILQGDYRQVVAMLAVFKAGGIYLPLRLDEPEERWQRMMLKTSPTIVVVGIENLDTVKPRLARLPKPPHILVVTDDEIQQYYQWHGTNYQCLSVVASNQEKVLLPEADDSNYIMFTSGSTGEPKAILGSHGSLRHFINWEKLEFGINHNCRCLQISQIHFDAYLRETLVTLCSGGTLYIPDSTDREDLERLLLRLGEWQINLLHTVPSVMRLFLKIGRNLAYVDQLLKNLQVLVLAGEPLFVKELCEWHKVFGEQTEFVNIYGATETTFVKHFYRIPDLSKITYARVPAGKTLSDTAFAVIDGTRACAVGEVGEIFVKSPYLTKGYYQDEKLTNLAFVPNPLNNGSDLVYRTGDLGRLLPDMNLEVIGRSDNQIKLNGVRIELGEIEDAIDAIDGVEKTLVVADKNEELVTVIAYYQGNDTANEEYIKRKIKQVLPTYMQPTFLIRLEYFPLLANGKINRLSLPKPEANITQISNKITSFNQQEALLASIWSDLLEVKVSDANQSFFELGGNSLKAMRLVSDIRNRFGISLRLREIFTHNTLKAQADLIQSRQEK